MSTVTFSFDPTCALPNVAYRDPELLAAEMTWIWHGDWVFVTTEDALAARGDQLPVVIGNQPVLLVRNQEGELAAFSNLCSHRGTLLIDRPTNATRIQCPYHGWTYTDAGELLAVPFATSEAIDKAAHCLPAYRIESWHGLIFVSLNPDVEPLVERFAVVEPHVAARGMDWLHHRADQQDVHVWDCNWKLAIINAMESYHLFKVHRTTLEPYTPTKGAYYIAGSARGTATGGRVKGDDDYLLVSLPPAFVGVFSGGSFYWQSVRPIDVGRCAVRTGGAFASPPRCRLPGQTCEVHRCVRKCGRLADGGFSPRGQGHLRTRAAWRVRRLCARSAGRDGAGRCGLWSLLELATQQGGAAGGVHGDNALTSCRNEPDDSACVVSALFGESGNWEVEICFGFSSPARHVSRRGRSTRRHSGARRKQSENTLTQARARARAATRDPGTWWPVEAAAESRCSRRTRRSPGVGGVRCRFDSRGSGDPGEVPHGGDGDPFWT